MKKITISLARILLLSAVLGWPGAAIAQVQDPIALIGHGVMFDEQGNQIQATPDFIEKAQAFYIEKLSARLQPAQKTRFDTERARYFETFKRSSVGQEGDKQGNLIINAALIDWLIRQVPLDDAGELQGKNNLIKSKLRYRLFQPEIGAPYAASQELLNLLKHQLPDARKR